MRHALARSLVCLPLLLAAGACSGGDGTLSMSGVTVALTDAASQEISSFTVDITSFRLQRANGAQTGILGAPVRVDLVSLVDMSHVLNVKSVPAGFYTGATVTFDFSSAVCVIAGNPTPATILDSGGTPLTGTLTVPIDFGSGALNAVAGKHKLLELDFNLDQSFVVDSGANTVSLEPVLVMHVDPASPKQLVAVGELVAVDPAAMSFTARLESLTGSPIGTLEVGVLSLSVFQVDGVPSVGPAGLLALAAKPGGTWIQAYGVVDPDAPRLQAVFVAAGAGTWNGGSDIVEGHVTARSSGAGTSATLTVQGHSGDASHTTFQFNTAFTVTTTFGVTKVLKVGSPLPLTLDDVNVGQRVRIFGSLSGTALDATAADAVVRLQPTRVYGFANAAVAGNVLTMALSRVGLLPETDFTWADSGANPPVPAAFTLDVAGLTAGLGILAGSAVEGRGWFAPVDDAGSDHQAISASNLDSAPSLLLVRDVASAGHVLAVTAISTEIQLAITGSAVPGEVAVVDKGFVGGQPLPAAPVPSIRPPASGIPLYFLHDKLLGSTKLYLAFAPFSNAVGMAVAQGAHVLQVGALGAYDAPGNFIQAPLAVVVVE